MNQWQHFDQLPVTPGYTCTLLHSDKTTSKHVVGQTMPDTAVGWKPYKPRGGARAGSGAKLKGVERTNITITPENKRIALRAGANYSDGIAKALQSWARSNP